MQDGSNSKQLIAEKIKQSANILVTVSSNPSVDALTAALGLTLMLNKLDKHATAVFSGVIPPAINFLEPNKTFENNVDSLRDFIIALDKDKADRLRYKVEDDVVRIFITPYRTKISQSDLQFSQGDFNVDLIVALGVEDQRELDQAITAHGRILHDATVVTINAAAQKSSLGSIDWQDRNASSLSEMLASISETLKPGMLDQQISTALLTGIVASTERFSNQHTTPHVMTIAAQLMAAGANQQLIATKLQSIPAPVSPRREKPKSAPSEASKKVNAQPTPDDGEMHINHNDEKQRQPAPLPMESAEPPTPEPAPEPEPEPEMPITPPPAQSFDDLKEAIQQDTVQTSPRREMTNEPSTPGSHNINDAESDNDEQPKPEQEESYLTTHPSWQGREIKPPSMGGTLSATAEQALEDKMREESQEKQNRTILTHGGSAGPVQNQPQQQQSSSSRNRKRKNKQSQQQSQPKQQSPAPKVTQQASPPPTPVAAPKSAPAPVQPQPAMEVPAPREQPVEPAPQPAIEPVQPVEPVVPPEIPVAPPPLVVSEPLTSPPAEPPAPAPEMPPEPALTPEPTPPVVPPSPAAQEPTLEELEREAARHAEQAVAPQTLSELEAARQQTNAALASSEPVENTAPTPQPEVLPPLPPMPDFSTLPPALDAAPELPQPPPTSQPVPPQPPQELAPPPSASQPASPPAAPPAPTDPGQFRIPGQ